MTPYQAWYGDKPDLSRLRVIGSKGEYLIPPKQRKKLTEPRTRPCILLGYEGNTNYRILLEDGRIVGTPNAEFHEVLTAPSTQTIEDVGARRDGSPGATAAAAGGSKTAGLINQPSVGIRQASVPASGRQLSMAPPERALPKSRDDISHILPRSSNDNSRVLTQSSDDDSQPSVVAQGDRTLSPTRSDDTFGSFTDDLQDIIQRNDSPPGGDQQQDDAQQGLVSGEWQRSPELQIDRPVHEVRQEALEHHPELRIRAPHVTLNTSSDSEEELALMNIPEENVIPTFLTVAAKEKQNLLSQRLCIKPRTTQAGSNGKEQCLKK